MASLNRHKILFAFFFLHEKSTSSRISSLNYLAFIVDNVSEVILFVNLNGENAFSSVDSVGALRRTAEEEITSIHRSVGGIDSRAGPRPADGAAAHAAIARDRD